MSQPKSSSSPRKLGRGLSGMLGTPVAVQAMAETPQAEAREAVTQVDVGTIRPNPFQPRQDISSEGLAPLIDSIKQSGVLQPIIIRTKQDPDGQTFYELIAGERRWRAAKAAGLTHVPAIVREVTDEQSAEIALIENVQREDLNTMDRAWAIRNLQDRFGLTAGQVGERVGLDRSSVANFLRLTELEPEIQLLVREGRLSAGHGKALLAVTSAPVRVALAKSAASGEWSVRRTEGACKQAEQLAPEEVLGPTTMKPPAVIDLERQLGAYLGTKVEITTRRAGAAGTIGIEFYSLDHFDGLMGRIGFHSR
ncbi:MAG: ParB/RepB/Spo0J family partition protein [Phycisphaeraceae bacterium]|nr:ParB/RepB/Spo0J family partition protein [Phycisphaeraceae bacterium]MCW5754033.1 ParB/RepB/Spo0J family partition protein [Phycisphaeraceae bacterium]